LRLLTQKQNELEEHHVSKTTSRTRATADARGDSKNSNRAATRGRKAGFRMSHFTGITNTYPLRTIAGTQFRPAETSALSATASGNAESPTSMIAQPGAVTRRARHGTAPGFTGFAPAEERFRAPVFTGKLFGADYLTATTQ
jgi:hypothetical protein